MSCITWSRISELTSVSKMAHWYILFILTEFTNFLFPYSAVPATGCASGRREVRHAQEHRQKESRWWLSSSLFSEYLWREKYAYHLKYSFFLLLLLCIISLRSVSSCIIGSYFVILKFPGSMSSFLFYFFIC